MPKIRELTLLAISCLTMVFAGCGDSTGGYGIFRSNDLVTVFIPLSDTSEIAEVKIDNKALHVNIDTGEKIVPHVIQLRGRFFPVAEPDETVESHGENRINDYAVIHLRTFDTKHKVSKFVNLSISKFYDFKLKNSDEKPERFDNSGAFRFGNKIIAYAPLQGNIDSQSKGFKFNTGPVEVEIKNTKGTVNTHGITEDVIGERILILEDYDIDTDKRIRNLHFLLKDLEPHETVEIEEIKNLGDKIVIAELAVEPQEKQPPKPQAPERISDR